MAGPGSPPPRRGPARAERGGIQASRAAPPPVYLFPGPGAASFSTLSAVSLNAPATPPPPVQWLCSRDLVVSPAPFPRSPRLHSPLTPTLQLRPPPPLPPLLFAAMEPSTFALVPVFTQLNNLPRCLPVVGAASIAIAALRLCLSHVTPGDPGTGAGQGPAPS